MMRRAILVSMLVVALAAALLWAGSGALLRWGLHALVETSGGRLRVEALRLDAVDDLRIGLVRWTEPAAGVDAPAALDLTLRDIRFEWRVLALLVGQIDVGRLSVASAEVRLPASDGLPVRLPAAVSLPMRVAVRQASLEQLRIERAGEAPVQLSGIAFGARYDRDAYRIDDLTLSGEWGGAQVSARITDAAPFRLEGRGVVTLRALPAGLPAARLELAARGNLEEIALDARLMQPGDPGHAVATVASSVRPFAVARLPSAFEVVIDGLDLSGWSDRAPRTALSGVVRIDGFEATGRATPDLGARIELVNAAISGAGALPAGRLATRLRLRDGRLRFDGLSVETGDLRLRADLALANSRLSIDRATLDAGALGTVTASGGLELSAPWNLRASGTHEGGTAWPVALGGVWRAEGPLAALDGSSRTVMPLRVMLGIDRGELAGLPVRGTLSGALSRPGGPGSQPDPPESAASTASGPSTPSTQPSASMLRIGDRPMPRIDALQVELSIGDARLAIAGALGSVADRLSATLRAPSIGPLARAFGQDGVSGALSVDARIAGDPRAPSRVDANIDLRDPAVRGVALRRLQVEVSGAAAGHAVRARFDGDRAQGRIVAAGALTGGLRWRGTLDEFTLARPLAGRLSRPARIEVDGASVELADLTIESAFGSLRSQRAAWRDGIARVEAAATVTRLTALLEALGLPSGNATADATLDALTLELDTTLSGTSLDDLDGRIAARLRGAPSASGSGRIDLTLRAGALSGEADLRLPTLAFANRIIGPEWAVDGRLAVTGRITGTLRAPKLDGELTGEGLGFEQRAMGWRLRNGTLSARFDTDRLQVRSLKLHSETTGGGWAELRGEVRANGQGSFELGVDRLPVPIGPGQRIVLSGTANAQSTDARLELRGKLRADEGLIELAGGDAPTLPDDVVVLRRRTAGAGDPDRSEAASRAGGAGVAGPRTRLAVTADLALDLGEKLRVRGSGVDARLGGTLQLRGTLPDAPRAYGTVRIRDGAYQAYGRRLEIVRGTVVFNGPLDNPALDILALRREQPVQAGVALTGTVLSPVIRLASRPEVPDVEKLSWLVLGVPLENVQSGAQGAALQAAAATLFGRNDGTLTGGLARALGVDVVTLRSASIGSGGLLSAGLGGVGPNAVLPAVPGQVGSPRASAGSGSVGDSVIAVGKRLGSGFTVTYEQGLRGVWNLLRIQYALSRRLTLRAQTGSESALDLLYRVSFD
ncbi:MAG: hypothetical protein RIS35_901 [Pseudomonadota bacterium]